MKMSWMILLATGAAAGCTAAWIWKSRTAKSRRRKLGSISGRLRLRNGHGASGRRRRARFSVSAS